MRCSPRRSDGSIGPEPPSAPAIAARSTKESLRSPRRLRVLAQHQKQLRKIRRYGTLQGQALARTRMIETQRRGVQGLAPDPAQCVDKIWRRAARQLKSPAIDRVADDRILDV